MWEIIARPREVEGDEAQRIAAVAAETGLHARQIRCAIDFAAEHPADVERLIERNEAAQARSGAATEQRQALLGLGS